MIIGICGGTGSGKTTIAKRLYKLFGAEKALLIEQDSYYKDLIDLPLDERKHKNFDSPDSIDFDLLETQLADLRDGKTVDLPVYDFKTHTRSKDIRRESPHSIIILEGILIFAHEAVRKSCDIRIFVDAPEKVRFERRLARDVRDRGRTPESVRAQWNATVKPGHDEFVERYKEAAHIVVENNTPIDKSVKYISRFIARRMEEING